MKEIKRQIENFENQKTVFIKMKHTVDNVKMNNDAAKIVSDVNQIIEMNKESDDKLRDGMLDF